MKLGISAFAADGGKLGSRTPPTSRPASCSVATM